MDFEKSAGAASVTTLIRVDVKAGEEEQFEEWAKQVSQRVRTYPGYEGTNIILPRDHQHPEYVIIIRFDCFENIRSWMECDERRQWLKKAESLTIGSAQVEYAEGLQSWFTLPEYSHHLVAPPKHKMVVLAASASFPLLLATRGILEYLFPTWPGYAVLFVNIIMFAPMMTYLVMPWMTRCFRGWLYPEGKS